MQVGMGRCMSPGVVKPREVRVGVRLRSGRDEATGRAEDSVPAESHIYN
jgi:hypothetical protein